MAITGPFSRTVTSTATSWQARTWYRQTPPYQQRLNYEVKRCELASWFNETVKSSNNPANQSYNPLDGSPAYQPALQIAYERLKSACQDKAEVAVSLGERRQAVDMMSKRLVQMGKFVKSLRKGDVEGAMKVLGVNRTRKKRVSNARKEDQFQEARRTARNESYEKRPASEVYNEAFDGFNGSPRYHNRWPKKPKTTARDFGEWFSDTFLEFHFGWEPLVKDIWTGIEALQRPYLPIIVRGRGAAARWQGSPKQFQGDTLNGVETWWRSKVQLIANLTITSDNLWLANTLGLVNPVTWLWEWTPFSFIVDWFSNVGSFLSQCTDFLGASLGFPATTHTLDHSYKKTEWSAFTGGLVTFYVKKWKCMRRSTGLSKPDLQLKPFQGFSLTRGLTAMSLVLQTLKGVK